MTWSLLSTVFLVIAILFQCFRLITKLPRASEALVVHPSIGGLPPSAIKTRIQEIYPETLYGERVTYAILPAGKTKYALLGPENGRRVVFVHGFSTPSVIFKEVVDHFVAQGFRVLVYDLYGRGYSDAPDTRYDVSLYTTQLALLFQHIKWDKACIVGLSMGGGIAASFCNLFPDLVDGHVAFLASSGLFPDMYFSWTIGLLTSSITQYIYSSPLIRSFLNTLPPPPTSRPEAISQLFTLQSAVLPGYAHALSSSIRYGPLRGLEKAFAGVGMTLGLDVLVIHGTADRTVPYVFSSRLLSLVPQARRVTLDGVGHELVVTHPLPVARALVEFFKEGKTINNEH